MQTFTEKTRDWRALTAAVYRGLPPRRLLAALALTLLLHLAVYEAAPSLLTTLSRTVVPAKPAEIVRVEEFEEIPETLLPEEFRKKPQFVPVNPNAPTATPKDDANLSAADQRAAQENPDPDSRSRMPTNDGELEDSRAVAEAVLPRELLPPEPRAPASPPAAPAPEPRVPAAEETPRDAGADVAVEGGEIAAGDDAPKTGEKKDAAETAEEKIAAGDPADALPDPQPRPQIVPRAGLNSITMRSNTAVNEIGACSLDAKFSEYGDYTQRMLEAIQAAWYITVWRSAIVQPPAVVVVEFTLHADGTIDGARVVYSDASDPATYACLDAVVSRAPFERWRADMVAVVGGESETGRISFYYR